jgi:hypothetical protein
MSIREKEFSLKTLKKFQDEYFLNIHSQRVHAAYRLLYQTDPSAQQSTYMMEIKAEYDVR